MRAKRQSELKDKKSGTRTKRNKLKVASDMELKHTEIGKESGH
jgi:hypothetical protein